jgi:Mpv17 / PMP22 family
MIQFPSSDNLVILVLSFLVMFNGNDGWKPMVVSGFDICGGSILLSSSSSSTLLANFDKMMDPSYYPILLETTVRTVLQATHWHDITSVYQNQLTQHPLPTKMLTGATLSMLGDAFAQNQQKRIEQQQQQQVETKKPSFIKTKISNPPSRIEYDIRRTCSFGLFDMTYRGLQHFAFPIIVTQCNGQNLLNIVESISSKVTMMTSLVSSSSILPTIAREDTTATFLAFQTTAASIEQALASQLLIVPFFYYPIFFTLTGMLQGLTIPQMIQRAQENFIPLMKRNLLFWIPIQYIQFSSISDELQIPFLSVCGLLWTFILSIRAGSTKQYSSASNDSASQSPSTMTAIPKEVSVIYNFSLQNPTVSSSSSSSSSLQIIALTNTNEIQSSSFPSSTMTTASSTRRKASTRSQQQQQQQQENRLVGSEV